MKLKSYKKRDIREEYEKKEKEGKQRELKLDDASGDSRRDKRYK